MVVEAKIKWGLTFSDILELANGAFKEINDKITFTICVVKDLECLIGYVALEGCCLTNLFTAEVIWSCTAWFASFFNILAFTHYLISTNLCLTNDVS